MSTGYEQLLEAARARGKSDEYRGLRHDRFLLLPASARESLFKCLLMERSGYRCGLCGLPLGSQADTDIDHIRPKFYGGTDALTNLQPTHARCNRSKGKRWSGVIAA